MNPGATAVVVLRRPVPPIARRSAERAIRAHCADSCARDRRHDRFRENRTAIALADHPLPVSATTAAELATAGLDRDDLESVLRLIWPSMAELHACFHLSQRRQAARDDAAFNELIARLDEEDDDCDG